MAGTVEKQAGVQHYGKQGRISNGQQKGHVSEPILDVLSISAILFTNRFLNLEQFLFVIYLKIRVSMSE